MTDLRVTRAGAYVDVGGAALSVTRAGAYVQITRAEALVTRAGAYVEITSPQVHITGAGAYVQIRLSPIDTQAYAVQWRAFVGPPWRRADAADFYDWSALNYGDIDYAFPGPAQLQEAMTPASMQCDVLFLGPGTHFPDAGGCWIGPGASGETWEYVTYSSITELGTGGFRLVLVSREPADAEQSGAHSLNASCVFWWPLASDNGETEFSEELDDNVAAVTWSGKLAGLNIPQAAIRNRHLCLIQCRWLVPGPPSASWQTELIGWLLSPQAHDDWQHERSWQADLASSAMMASFVAIGGVRVGAIDLARGGSAEASTSLQVAGEMANTGEYQAAQPDLSAKSAIDGDLTTLYMSDRVLGAPNAPTGYPTSMGNYLDQVHIAADVGQAPGHRWIQLSQSQATSTDHSWAQGFKLIGPTNYFPGRVAGGGLQQGFIFGKMPHPNGKLILCENADLFNADHPTQDPDTTVIEISQYALSQGSAMPYGPLNFYFDGPSGPVQASQTPTTGQWGYGNPRGVAGQWWDDLLTAGGALCCSAFTGQVWNATPQVVFWGNITAGQLNTSGCLGWRNDWSGGNLAAPAAGQTLRRNWSIAAGNAAQNTAAAWFVDEIETPGYFIDGSRILWLQAHLARLALQSRDALTSSSPGTGGTLYVVGTNNDATVDGLPASGTVQIGAEQISYSAKTAANDGLVVSARGASGTVAAAHLNGDQLLVVVDGTALDLRAVTAVTLTRPAGLPVPTAFRIWASTRDKAGTEDSNPGAYVNDYDLGLLHQETSAAWATSGGWQSFTFSLPGNSNLLANGGFETPASPGPFAGWTAVNGVGSVLAVTDSYVGTYAADLTTPGGGTSPTLSQTLTVAPGTAYVWTFWTVSEDGSPGTYAVATAGGSPTILASGNAGPGGYPWQQVSVPFTVPAGITSVILTLSVPEAATFAHFDACVLLAAGGAPGTAYVSTLMIECTRMSATWPFCLNDLEALADPAAFSAARNLEGGAAVVQALAALLTLAGIPRGAILDAEDTPIVDDFTTDVGMAWNVAADLASFAGCRLTCQRDSKFHIGLDPFWAASGVPVPDHSWTNAEIASLEPQWRHGYGVGQIRLAWRNADNSAGGVAYYPAECDALGAVADAGPFYCADAAAAAARAAKLYWLKRLPYEANTEAAGAAMEVHAGDVAASTWQLDPAQAPLSRSYLVKSLAARFTGQACDVLPALLQAGRQDEK